MMHIWNTKTRSLKEFKPLKDGEVTLYTCGPTVYNPVTIGNWRAFIFDDVLKRSLRFCGYHVKHVMNITDVGHLVGDADEGEDKIAREAVRTGKTAWDVAKTYEAQFREGMKALRILSDEEDEDMKMPRATDTIPEQIALIETLEKRGHTYRTSDGIYFDTSTFPAYGALSGQKLEDKEAGARVAVNEEKKHPSDFALWKFSPPTGGKRDMEWEESPWGVGFPGWHVECSAMARMFLGQPIDIHCGGVDHIPVHHENEIAQSECAYGSPFANYWMHNEFLLVDGRRMGKSEGNAYTLDDLRAKGIDPLAFRLYCLGTHYKQKLNFTWEGLEGANVSLSNIFYHVRQLVRKHGATIDDGKVSPEALAPFYEALSEDLNTSRALAELHAVLRLPISASDKLACLVKMDEVLGLGMLECAEKSKLPFTEIPESILHLVKERERARLEKRFTDADKLRSQIHELGYDVQDEKTGGYTLVKL